MTQANASRGRVIIFDTTMRDGEQSPGASMSLEEKLELAKILEEMGVDVIEAGFPIASNGDFEAVTRIAQMAQNAVICGLARAGYKDIDRCAEAMKHAKRGAHPHLHRHLPLHRAIPNLDMDQMAGADQRLGDPRAQPLRRRGVVAEDATRTEHDFLRRASRPRSRPGRRRSTSPTPWATRYRARVRRHLPRC